jgi:hypothetical protein
MFQELLISEILHPYIFLTASYSTRDRRSEVVTRPDNILPINLKKGIRSVGIQSAMSLNTDSFDPLLWLYLFEIESYPIIKFN